MSEPLDLEAAHLESLAHKPARLAQWCQKCSQQWPCTTFVLVARVRELEAALRKLLAEPLVHLGYEDGRCVGCLVDPERVDPGDVPHLADCPVDEARAALEQQS